MNFRLPSIGRTLMCLSRLRDELRGPPQSIMRVSVAIVQVLVPKQRSDSDAKLEEVCRECGAKPLWLSSNEGASFFAERVLPEVNGNFLWTVPAGAHVMLGHLSLSQALMSFEDPSVALLWDGLFSAIYRAQPLRSAVASSGGPWPNDVHAHRQRLETNGYKASVAKQHLAEIEEIYQA